MLFVTVAIALTAVAAVAIAQAQPARRSISLVVLGGTVITQNAARQIISPGAVAIDGSDIVDVDRPEAIAARYNPTQTIRAEDQIVLPGLINTHTHAPMVLYRGVANLLGLIGWVRK